MSTYKWRIHLAFLGNLPLSKLHFVLQLCFYDIDAFGVQFLCSGKELANVGQSLWLGGYDFFGYLIVKF